MADKLRAQQQLQQLETRYVGTGHPDTTKFEFASNIHRDVLASILGHPALLTQTALAMGMSRERLRLQLIESMMQPVGPPPETKD